MAIFRIVRSQSVPCSQCSLQELSPGSIRVCECGRVLYKSIRTRNIEEVEVLSDDFRDTPNKV